MQIIFYLLSLVEKEIMVKMIMHLWFKVFQNQYLLPNIIVFKFKSINYKFDYSFAKYNLGEDSILINLIYCGSNNLDKNLIKFPIKK